MRVTSKPTPRPDQPPFILEPSLARAAVTGFSPDFTRRVLNRLPVQSPSIWTSLIHLGRPVLVTASVLALVILALHLLLIDRPSTESFDLTDFSFEVMVADGR